MVRALVLLHISCSMALCAAFVVDTSRAPDLKPWAEHAATTWEQAYPMICDELASPGLRAAAHHPDCA
jgi:hypothetical protein